MDELGVGCREAARPHVREARFDAGQSVSHPPEREVGVRGPQEPWLAWWGAGSRPRGPGVGRDSLSLLGMGCP